MAESSAKEPKKLSLQPVTEETKPAAAADEAPALQVTEEATPETQTAEEPKVEEEKPKTEEKPKARSKDWEFQAPPWALVTRIQRALGRRGRYSGPANGDFNEKTAIGVQKTLATEGFKGKHDGDLETRNQVQRIQEYAKDHGSYTGEIDRKLTDDVWSGFAYALERKA